MPEAVPPRFVLIIWPVIDRFLRAIEHIRPLKTDNSGIIHFSLHRYKGPVRALDDGSEVRTGDTVMELHMNNNWFRRRRKLNLKISRSPWEILDSFEQDLRFLAQQVVDGRFEGVAALHGITFLYTGARRLGFQVDELPDGLWKWGARFYMTGLMRIYNLRTDETPRRRSRRVELREIWLSRRALLSRFGPKDE